jgi:hypothetical protein
MSPTPTPTPDLLNAITSGSASLASGTAGLTDALSEMGGTMFTTSNIVANLLFSAIGFVAFVYGRKMSLLRPALIGVALMGYPWFVSDTRLMWGVGAVLTVLLFVWRG